MAAAPYDALFAPRHAPAALPSRGQQQVTFELLPGAPPCTLNMLPGMTMAQARKRAADLAGLALANPHRPTLRELYPTWADPVLWPSLEELQAKAGHVPEVILSSCHDTHSRGQQHLVIMTWTANEQGGSCSVGCGSE